MGRAVYSLIREISMDVKKGVCLTDHRDSDGWLLCECRAECFLQPRKLRSEARGYQHDPPSFSPHAHVLSHDP
ncbi:hypothetical protein NDU88_013113 [Pleurodeles waltl]|uniref:Uncharacterized protein n=1 Tax=Pleurodeles waltl TaxID=8319 RepID=A0AAV7R812_PLEWA|nr:hypothetical protein NDU88_013113 [Pleurodeles waltl]